MIDMFDAIKNRKSIAFHMAILLICTIMLSSCTNNAHTLYESEPIASASQDRSIESSNAQADQPCNETIAITDVMAAYQQVLLGTQNYCEAQSSEYLSINQLYYVDDIFPASPRKFVIQDLDDDKVPEVIVQMDMNGVENFGSLILHFEDNRVVGYHLWRRAFGGLKVDNTFSTSGGAFDHGYSRIDFSAFEPDDYEGCHTIIQPVCYCTSNAEYDKNGSFIEKYYNDGVEITAEEFEQEQKRQSEKEDAPWMEFTEDNINQSIALFQNSSEN